MLVLFICLIILAIIIVASIIYDNFKAKKERVKYWNEKNDVKITINKTKNRWV